jgi:septum formation protein
MAQWVLASSSPRRQELLKLLLADFEVVPSEVDESARIGETPDEVVVRLAHEKASLVRRRRPEACVIGADTLVVCDGDILGKPTSGEQARRMLRTVSGRTHQVLTGVCLLCLDRVFVERSRTDVTFCNLTEKEIEDYLRSGEPFDKAGAYGIQGLGARFVERIDGCHFNVVGLPVSLLYRMMKGVNAEVRWRALA